MSKNARLSAGLAGALLLAASPAVAQTTSAPASDFAAGAVACTTALTPAKLDESTLKASGWTVSAVRGPVTIYVHDGIGVRLFLTTMMAPTGQCVVDGYATGDDQFRPIRDAIRAALAQKYGASPEMPKPVAANGQGFVVDKDLVLVLSMEKRTAGPSIRITGMRFAKQ